MNKLRLVLMLTLLGLAGTAAADQLSSEAVKERTQPTGKVLRVGETQAVVADASPAADAQQATSGRSGEQLFTEKCAMCHGAGLAGAPKMGEPSAWKDRIAQGEATLFEHAINGFQGSTGFMPAKGGCFDCSDDEVKAAVLHIMKSSQ